MRGFMKGKGKGKGGLISKGRKGAMAKGGMALAGEKGIVAGQKSAAGARGKKGK